MMTASTSHAFYQMPRLLRKIRRKGNDCVLTSIKLFKYSKFGACGDKWLSLCLQPTAAASATLAV